MNPQEEHEHAFRQDPDPVVRSRAFAWFSASPAQAEGRERIPLDLIYESAVDESSGVGAMIDVRQVILRGMVDCVTNNPETRQAVQDFLQRYQDDRRTLDRDRVIAAQSLAAIQT